MQLLKRPLCMHTIYVHMYKIYLYIFALLKPLLLMKINYEFRVHGWMDGWMDGWMEQLFIYERKNA